MGYVPRRRPHRVIGVMANKPERTWTAHLVIASEHAGLKPVFRAMEDEMRHVLARVDEPRDARRYITVLRQASRDWLDTFDAERPGR